MVEQFDNSSKDTDRPVTENSTSSEEVIFATPWDSMLRLSNLLFLDEFSVNRFFSRIVLKMFTPKKVC